MFLIPQRAALAAVLTAAFSINAAHATDCPSSDTPDDGFVLDGTSVTSEVYRGPGPITRVVNTFSDYPKQTVFYFRGLFELLSASRASKTARHPLVGLDRLFPLKQGDRHSFEFVPMVTDDVPGAPWLLEIDVAGEEEIRLGDCRYDVLLIRQVVTDDRDRMVDEWVALYAPELEMTLGKRYDEGTSREMTVSYSGIREIQLK